MNETERELYEFFRIRTSHLLAGVFSERSQQQQRQRSILPLINFLRLICDHGEELLPPAALNAWRSRDALAIDWKIMRCRRQICALCEADTDPSESSESDSLQFESSCFHTICSNCRFRKNEEDLTFECNSCPICARESDSSRSKIRDVSNSRRPLSVSQPDYQPSSKVSALLTNICQEQSTNQVDKSNEERPVKRYVKRFQCNIITSMYR